VKRVFIFLLGYVLFLVQAALPAWWPDMMLLYLIAVSAHESKLASALLGAFLGLCLDMTAPAFLGSGLVVAAGIGYGVSSLRAFLYRARWATLLFALSALTLKWLALAFVGPGLPPWPLLAISSGCTLLLAPLIDATLTRLLYAECPTA
jgi:cell shape-determining protein MreD